MCVYLCAGVCLCVHIGGHVHVCWYVMHTKGALHKRKVLSRLLVRIGAVGREQLHMIAKLSKKSLHPQNQITKRCDAIGCEAGPMTASVRAPRATRGHYGE